MLKSQSRVIGNHTYKVRQLGASEGRKMLVRLVKVLGPVLAALLRATKGQKLPPAKVEETPEPTAPEATEAPAEAPLEVFCSRLSEVDLDYLVSTLGPCTEVILPDGRVQALTLDVQEMHFAGSYGEMFKWLGFALEVNYSDFFGKSSAVVEALTRMEKAGAQKEKVS
jgi:hypothetical protein